MKIREPLPATPRGTATSGPSLSRLITARPRLSWVRELREAERLCAVTRMRTTELPPRIAPIRFSPPAKGACALAMAILPPAGPTSNTMYPLATNGLAGPQVHGFRLGVDYTYNYFTSDHWEARLKFWSTEGGGTVSLLSSTLLVKYAWSQIAVIYDGATAKMYINGTLVGQQTGTITNGTETFKVGGGFNSRIFDGTIDEVRVWQG